MEWIETLKEWQTLVAGAVALVAGLVVLLQTQEMRRQDAQRTKRRHAAARAVMPLALSVICDYARKSAHILSDIRTHTGSDDSDEIESSPHYPDFPEVPAEVIPKFADVIESSGNGTAKAFISILADIQIHSSRLRTLTVDLASQSNIVLVQNVDHNIVDSLELYASAEALFGYARGKDESVPAAPLEAERIFNVKEIIGLYGQPNMIDLIKQRAEERQAAWKRTQNKITPLSILKGVTNR